MEHVYLQTIELVMRREEDASIEDCLASADLMYRTMHKTVMECRETEIAIEQKRADVFADRQARMNDQFATVGDAYLEKLASEDSYANAAVNQLNKVHL